MFARNSEKALNLLRNTLYDDIIEPLNFD